MALPAGYDIGFAIATSGITDMLMARLRLGGSDPGSDGGIDPTSPPLGALGYRIVSLEWLPAPDRGPAECWFSIICTPSGGDLSTIDIGVTLALRTDAAGTMTLGVVFREAADARGPVDRSFIADLVDQIEAAPLLDVTLMLTTISSAMAITLPPATAVSTGLLAGDGTNNEGAIGLLVSTSGLAAWPTGVASWIHTGRHVALAFGGPFMESTVVPAAIAARLGALPAELEPGVELRSLGISFEPTLLRLSGSAAHPADPGVGTVNFGGPLRPWYSQVGQAVVIDSDEVDAFVPVSLVLLLGGPVGVLAIIALDLIVDSVVAAAVRNATTGLLGGLDPTTVLPAGEPPVGAVMRWAAIEDGSLVLGLSLHAGPQRARIVATSGKRRLRLVQFDNDDVLSVADAVNLIELGVLEVADVHVVRSASTGGAWLRADHDSSAGNNLRELPGVDIGLIPLIERAPSR